MGQTASTTIPPIPPSRIADEFVHKAVRENQVVIFSKTTCTYCKAAKKLLSFEADKLQALGCTTPAPAVVELDDGTIPPSFAREVQTALGRMTGTTTVPRVFIEQNFVGGATETAEYARSGGLKMALMKAAKCDVDLGDRK